MLPIINPGLQQQDLDGIINGQITRTSDKYSQINTVVSFALGALSGIALTVSAIYALCTLKFTPAEPYTSPSTGVTSLRREFISPFSQVLFGAMGLPMGILGAPLIVGLGSFGLGILAQSKKIAQLNDLRAQLENKYEKAGQIGEEDISRLMKTGDRAFREALVKKMNFEQVYFAAKVLNKREFTQIVEKGDNRVHKQWLMLIKLSDKKPEEITADLKKEIIKARIIENPLFGIALREEIEKIGLKISEFEEPELNLTLATATEIAFNSSSSESSAKAADKFLAAGRHKLSTETIADLLKNPALILLRESVEKDLEGLNLTPTSHQAIKEKIDLYDLPDLREKYNDFAQTSLLKSDQTGDIKFWLETCRQVFDSDSFDNLIDSYLSVENIREVYAFAVEKNLKPVQTLCEKYCAKYKEEIKRKGIWLTHEVPEGLSGFLYSS